MPKPLDSLVARGESKALTLDQANALAYAMFGNDARVERLAGAGRLSSGFDAVNFGAAQLMKVHFAGFGLERNTDDSVHVSVPLSGSFRRGRPDALKDYAPSRRASIGRPFDRSRLEVADGSVLVLYAPRSVLVARAEQLTGEAQDPAALMSSLGEGLDLREPVAAALARQMTSAMAEMASLNAIGLGSLAAAATQEMLVNLLAAAVFPRVVRSLSKAGIDRSPAMVRRARDYIRAHAHEPIEVARLASDLGVSLRALQENFQRYLGLSPRELILACRLEHARARLLADDCELSVTTVALDSGFCDPGHFSARYRDTFGELPSQTLRRVRGQEA
jgi:AraC-like DNA-binding protein